jgi:group II intron reverse transcriptase/maturase/CRISPR-associated endonuclease Cas1
VKILPFERYLFRLRLGRTGAFHFNHGGIIHGLVKNALRASDIPPGVIPFACESGQVAFEPESPYHIGLTLAGDARALFPTLLEGLRRVGAEVPDPDQTLPALGGNFFVEGADLLPCPDLAAEESALRGRESIDIQLLSPLRVERPAQLVEKGRAYLDPACFDSPQFLDRLGERLRFLAKAATKEGADPGPSPEIPGLVRAEPRHLLWLDVPLLGRADAAASRPKGYTLGGVLGSVRLFGIPDEWLPLLVLGQYLHVGGKTRYGFGRFRIEAGGGAPEAFRPARWMLERAAAEMTLGTALDETVAKSEASGVDSVSPRDFAFGRAELLPALARDLRHGGYRPQALLGFVARKESGRLRPLAIPTVRDRVAQRAAGSILGPAVDTLLEDCSYAYRKGFSRQGAARAIQKAYADGFRYVLDADIDAFFDSVPWDVLFDKLRALYPLEPLRETIEAWMKAPVVFDGKLIERSRGLPQGSPLSPLLANLFLDEFDEELLGLDYRLVRFADDFVVLCRDLDAAKRARDDAREALSHLGLTLSEEKTSIRPIDAGFGYLGYLFCRSVVVEEDRETASGADGGKPLPPDAVPAVSWLAQVPLERVRKVVEGRTRRGAALDVVPLGHRDAHGETSKRPLYVLDPDCRIELRDESLHVLHPDRPPETYPIRLLSHAVFVGRTRLTVPVLLGLGQLGVPSYFCHRAGILDAVFGPHQPDWPLWTAQGAFAADQAACVSFIREIVAAKLHNFAALLVRMSFGKEAAEAIRDLEKQCANKTEPESLLGLEGSGARFYFRAVTKALPAEWRFEGREKHPSPDPVNAMLSFGYTLLYNHVGTALYAASLNPRVGIFHQPHGAYEALACDLQEEFRHLVDGMVWAAIHRNEVKPADFEYPPAGAPLCLMTGDMRKRFIRSFEERLMTQVTPSDGETMTYAALLDRQSRQIRDLVLRRVGLYQPFRTHG